jgi:hypothetical protein
MTIEEKKELVTELVKKRLDTNNIYYDTLRTHYDEEGLTLDFKKKPMFMTSRREPFFNKMHFIVTDAESLEIQYIITSQISKATPEQYFQKRKL